MSVSRRRLLLVPAAARLAVGADAVFSVRDFGAAGDGTTLDTLAIQRAIDARSRQGGGRVVFPAGRYVSGTVLIQDNVTLRLETGAELLGSTNLADYRVIDGFEDGKGRPMGYCLVGAIDATGIGIEGGGTIDGRGKEVLAARKDGTSARPFLARFVRCGDVAVKGVSFRQSAAWAVHFFQCRNVDAERVSIVSHAGANNDGFDIDSCRGVRITACQIDTGDDAICLKTTSAEACRDVEVSRCTLRSACAAIKAGTESVGDFANIRVQKCVIEEAGLGGIKLCSVDGARMEGVLISEIVMNAGRVPVFLRLGARLKTFRRGEKPRPVGTMHNVMIRNMRAMAEGPAVVISGIPGHAVEGVELQNIEVKLPGGGTAAEAKVTVPEAEAAYPEIRMFGARLPAWGIYARHVKGLRMRDVKLDLESPDGRPPMACQDAAGVVFSGENRPANISEFVRTRT
jgi:polygalacturonase